MDEFLATIGLQAMKYTVRSGIALASSYALGQCSRLLHSVDNKSLYSELRVLEKRLDSKIKIISPAIELVQFKSGRGNVFLEAAVPLTKSLLADTRALGQRIAAAAVLEEATPKASSQSTRQGGKDYKHLLEVISDVRGFLERIDREIPLLQLAITASGESLSTSLPASISPSRLLQASTLLVVGDTQYAQNPSRQSQIGPTFHLSLYMLFLGHASVESGPQSAYGFGENERQPLWQEVIHKARVQLFRSAQSFLSENDEDGRHVRKSSGPSNANCGLEFAYHLEIIEDKDDGRAHDDEVDDATSCGVLSRTGIQETIPVHQLSKIFYTDTGRILNLGSAADGESNPVLLLKRDTNAPPFSRGEKCDMHNSMGCIEESCDVQFKCEDDEQCDVDRQLHAEKTRDWQKSHTGRPVDGGASKLPRHLDPEWIALEVYECDEDEPDHSECDSGSEDEAEALETNDQAPITRRTSSSRASVDSNFAAQIRNLSLLPSSCSRTSHDSRSTSTQNLEFEKAEALDFIARSPFRAITSSLALIDMLIRLAGLQEFQQTSHLSIPDNVLTFFLEETSTTGLSGDARRAVRRDTKRRVGFDPYTDIQQE
ncbi:Ran-binding-domain-containing protein [Drechmeria coniospora]|uniref:Ran-binding-domain-containing protein n=1 Tax=Drechmeria coniospora TaxID=98403 RepID=A0A151GDP7_DRECN|nr:Ran-binding-domain-containing protein [Drechmeria coniospora]KYK55173.1 Ran-binding-domain-containing protein [Drechmeria coniospora]ODA82201.1 hypothetical protein RJ55_00707 [Drechmeria coniospora]